MSNPNSTTTDQLLSELRKLIDSAPDFGAITLTADIHDGQIVKVNSGIERSYKVRPRVTTYAQIHREAE